MAAAIEHPNVIPVYAAGEEDGQLYLVMRYVTGTDLHGAAARARGLLEPLARRRSSGRSRRRSTPRTPPGSCTATSSPPTSCSAASTRTWPTSGLRGCGSDARTDPRGPVDRHRRLHGARAAAGEQVDARADVYSLGCVLFAALTGEPPFRARRCRRRSSPTCTTPPRPSEIGAPTGFDRVIARALAKDPADRYPSAGDLARAALAAAEGESVTESERSVAVGPAAPGVPTNGHAAAPTAVTTVNAQATG